MMNRYIAESIYSSLRARYFLHISEEDFIIFYQYFINFVINCGPAPEPAPDPVEIPDDPVEIPDGMPELEYYFIIFFYILYYFIISFLIIRENSVDEEKPQNNGTGTA